MTCHVRFFYWDQLHIVEKSGAFLKEETKKSVLTKVNVGFKTKLLCMFAFTHLKNMYISACIIAVNFFNLKSDTSVTLNKNLNN